MRTIKVHSVSRDQRQNRKHRERLIKEVHRAKQVEATTQRTADAKRAEDLRRFNARVRRNSQPGQRASSIHASQIAAKDKDPSIRSSSSEHTDAQPLVLDQAHDRSQEEKEASRKVASHLMISKGSSADKHEHPDSGNKNATHLVSRATAVSIGTTM